MDITKEDVGAVLIYYEEFCRKTQYPNFSQFEISTIEAAEIYTRKCVILLII